MTGFQPLQRKNYVIDQGSTWRDSRRWAPGGTPMNFAGATAALTLRVAPELPAVITVTTIPSSQGLVGLDTVGNYWWVVQALALAALPPIQRSLEFLLRVTYADGVTFDDLIEGKLFQRRNLGSP